MKKIAFRVDSGHHLGIGHLMRCLTLAEELFKYNTEIFFITKKHLGSRPELIPSIYKVFFIDGVVDANLPIDKKDDYSYWLGGSEEDDLAQTNAILGNIGEIDLFILDNYSLGIEYEKNINAKKIFVIDDLMNRDHFCDYFLDQNLQAKEESYSQLIKSQNTVLFLGPSFALLRPEFKTYRDKINNQPLSLHSIKKILVSFGGEDINHDTLKMTLALPEDVIKSFYFTILLKSSHQTSEQLHSWAKQYPDNVKVLSFSNMADLIVTNDLFIGAGGSTSWERLALGIPSAIVCVAENQRGICEELDRKKYVCYLGSSKDLSKEKWQEFFEKLKDAKPFLKMARDGLDLVDCLGVQKIVTRIFKG